MTVNLAKGKHKSCGCRAHFWPGGKPEPVAKVDRRRLPRPKVGKSHWPEYSAYRQMVERCHRQGAHNFQWYGARGVRVCDRWRYGEGGLTGFECFIADMGRRPEGLTLDRVDVNGHYEPANCRWATWAVQRANRRISPLRGGG